MKKLFRGGLLSAAVISAMTFASCLQVDSDYDLGNIKDSGVYLGGDLSLPLLDKETKRKLALWEYEQFDFIEDQDGDGVITWADLVNIPIDENKDEWSLSDQEMEVEQDVKDMLKKLAGESSLEMVISTRTSMNFDMSAKLRFFNVLGTKLEVGPVSIKPGSDYEVVTIPLTQDDIKFIVEKAKYMEPVLVKIEASNVTITENDWVQIGVGIRKEGGIGINDLSK